MIEIFSIEGAGYQKYREFVFDGNVGGYGVSQELSCVLTTNIG